MNERTRRMNRVIEKVANDLARIDAFMREVEADNPDSADRLIQARINPQTPENSMLGRRYIEGLNTSSLDASSIGSGGKISLPKVPTYSIADAAKARLDNTQGPEADLGTENPAKAEDEMLINNQDIRDHDFIRRTYLKRVLHRISRNKVPYVVGAAVGTGVATIAALAYLMSRERKEKKEGIANPVLQHA